MFPERRKDPHNEENVKHRSRPKKPTPPDSFDHDSSKNGTNRGTKFRQEGSHSKRLPSSPSSPTVCQDRAGNLSQSATLFNPTAKITTAASVLAPTPAKTLAKFIKAYSSQNYKPYSTIYRTSGRESPPAVSYRTQRAEPRIWGRMQGGVRRWTRYLP